MNIRTLLSNLASPFSNPWPRWIEQSTPDVYIVSFPKSGRTWLSFFLAHYFSAYYRLGIDVDMHSMYEIIASDGGSDNVPLPAWIRGDIPKIYATHRVYTPRFKSSKILFVFRDPCDVMVSYYFHQTKHRQKYHQSLSAFLHSRKHGMPYYQRWLDSWQVIRKRAESIETTYEEMTADFEAVGRRALEFVGTPVDEPLLATALHAASFDHMLKTELEGRRIPGHNYNREDRDARRIRRGVIGGHIDYLNDEDRAYIRAVKGAS